MAESVLTGFAAAGVPRRQATTDAVRPQGARVGGEANGSPCNQHHHGNDYYEGNSDGT